ncbi:MAG TPA: ABC transporter substrate-binding protein [Stellaceae bacterium]|nr:ABC transporter substrate-binding protein [Stellaceae bacterium]
MKRRTVIAGLLLAATISRARAQASKVYRIAVVSPSRPVGEMTETAIPDVRAFFQRLRQLGYVEGQNLTVERYSAGGRTEQFAALVSEIVRSKPDLIYAEGDRMAREAKAATDTIPVVAVVGDPITSGIAASLARPGGNITGVTSAASLELESKRLALLREMAPTASRVAFLVSRGLWESPYTAVVREAAQRAGISLLGPLLEPPFDEAEYRRAFATMMQHGADALLVSEQPENFSNRRLIVELAEQVRLPTIYPYHEFTDIGGLMAYGVEFTDLFRHLADQVDQILKGTKPGDIPFYQPTKYELVINLKTAKALGITMPPTLLIAADEVIE